MLFNPKKHFIIPVNTTCPRIKQLIVLRLLIFLSYFTTSTQIPIDSSIWDRLLTLYAISPFSWAEKHAKVRNARTAFTERWGRFPAVSLPRCVLVLLRHPDSEARQTFRGHIMKKAHGDGSVLSSLKCTMWEEGLKRWSLGRVESQMKDPSLTTWDG